MLIVLKHYFETRGTMQYATKVGGSHVWSCFCNVSPKHKTESCMTMAKISCTLKLTAVPIPIYNNNSNNKQCKDSAHCLFCWVIVPACICSS